MSRYEFVLWFFIEDYPLVLDYVRKNLDSKIYTVYGLDKSHKLEAAKDEKDTVAFISFEFGYDFNTTKEKYVPQECEVRFHHKHSAVIMEEMWYRDLGKAVFFTTNTLDILLEDIKQNASDFHKEDYDAERLDQLQTKYKTIYYRKSDERLVKIEFALMEDEKNSNILIQEDFEEDEVCRLDEVFYIKTDITVDIDMFFNMGLDVLEIYNLIFTIIKTQSA